MLVYVLFIIGFVVLIKSAGFVVDGATVVARRLNISDFVIAMTVVAFGTTMPELVVNLNASWHGNSEIAIGNILGSVIVDILLVLGLSAFISSLKVPEDTFKVEIPFALLAALVLFFVANDIVIDGAPVSILSRSDGVVLLFFFMVFIYHLMRISRDAPEIKPPRQIMSLWKAVLYMLLGFVGLFFGSQWIVQGAVQFATILGVSQSLIALTIVAIGTSLPELATSVMAALKKRGDISVGNIVGSVIFDIFWILGLGSFIRPLAFHHESNVDLAVVVAAILLLFVFSIPSRGLFAHTGMIKRFEGGVMLFVYLLYTVFLIVRG